MAGMEAEEEVLEGGKRVGEGGVTGGGGGEEGEMDKVRAPSLCVLQGRSRSYYYYLVCLRMCLICKQ